MIIRDKITGLKGWSLLTIAALLTSGVMMSWAAEDVDPQKQPQRYSPAYILSKTGLASGNARIYRPVFDNTNWTGDLVSYNLTSDGQIDPVPNWHAADVLDATNFANRKIFTNRLDGLTPDQHTAVDFVTLADLSKEQRDKLKEQRMLDFLRGSTAEEGLEYRDRDSVLGDIIHSNGVYVTYDAADETANRIYIGANDGMLHVFNAANGKEEYAFMPATSMLELPRLAKDDYVKPDGSNHRYFVDGGITVQDVVFADGSKHKVLVGGLGAGGKAYFALDITSGTTTNLKDKLLWEINVKTDYNASGTKPFEDLGYTYGRVQITRVNTASGVRWAAIAPNGYKNEASKTAVLYVIDIETGALIKTLDTGFEDKNGLSTPTAVDLDGNGTADMVYAGDLNGNVWRFDISSNNSTNWAVSFSGQPLFTALYEKEDKDADGYAGGNFDEQAITTAPEFVLHPQGGLLVMVATGRILSEEDADTNDGSQIQSVYGLRDRLDGTRPGITNLVQQSFIETTYQYGGAESFIARTSTNNPVPAPGKEDGWRIDLETVGERVVTDMGIRSGRLVFTSINPLPTAGASLVNEINYITGGAPPVIVYDANQDGVTNVEDNIEMNNDGSTTTDPYNDPLERISSIYQGDGLASQATFATLSGDSGTYFVNKVIYTPDPTMADVADPGLSGGHFDVDTDTELGGSTDTHTHEYDDKYDVKGVDYFNFLDGGVNINEAITNTSQRFKLIVVNADLSTGGRFSVNKTYDETNSSSYQTVTSYDDTPPADLPFYTLGSVPGALTLTELSMYFDVDAILNGGLVPTATGCVKDNKTNPETGKLAWRNGALTVWAVQVGVDGSGNPVDEFELIYHPSGNGEIIGIQSGMLWEATIFWHWSGPCYHDYGDLNELVQVDDGEGGTTTKTVFQIYLEKTIKENTDGVRYYGVNEDSDYGVEEGAGSEPADGGVVGSPPPEDVRRSDNLSNPNRVSWMEILN